MNNRCSYSCNYNNNRFRFNNNLLLHNSSNNNSNNNNSLYSNQEYNKFRFRVSQINSLRIKSRFYNSNNNSFCKCNNNKCRYNYNNSNRIIKVVKDYRVE
jgi:hypothetical protein